jgi:anaphase-promoting complex subunit 6
MAAYRTAERYFPGCHLANLFIGMEYLRMNNTQTALIHFNQAKSICQSDPMIYNEMGAAFYKIGNYDKAKETLA